MLLRRMKMSNSFYLRTKSYIITEDGFMHNHQSALDSQREQNAIDWRFGDPIEDEPVEDKDYPVETDYD